MTELTRSTKSSKKSFKVILAPLSHRPVKWAISVLVHQSSPRFKMKSSVSYRRKKMMRNRANCRLKTVSTKMLARQPKVRLTLEVP